MAEQTKVEPRLRWTRTVVVEGPATWVLATRARSLTSAVTAADERLVSVGDIRHTDERLEKTGVGGWEVVACPPLHGTPQRANGTAGHIPQVPLKGGA